MGAGDIAEFGLKMMGFNVKSHSCAPLASSFLKFYLAARNYAPRRASVGTLARGNFLPRVVVYQLGSIKNACFNLNRAKISAANAPGGCIFKILRQETLFTNAPLEIAEGSRICDIKSAFIFASDQWAGYERAQLCDRIRQSPSSRNLAQ